ncbi:hypothetical protein ASPWEDRAFT_54525 [Aspergillus wentii DTO 134E9]|uniref:D-xylose reductase [NAD(P)H] n=1 Tax=Aspergillus wentii DTO 134E9 TaxID=1073089 RepID=A0A1L9R8S0_ASPWE|nr:uncharacterized protein ASPWEDRAFT_54525 [Aspergillus wentii DTO 134E9]OJJ31316.1 hypothetical protein ASPWEDRAFT_54525 [Aspergillus wentii DTO 134E9]
MAQPHIPTIQLNDGSSFPIIGYGTGTAWFKSGDSTGLDHTLVEAAKSAIKLGFTHLDGAEVYGTEPELGQAIQESGVARDQLFVTTKVGPQSVRDIPSAIDASLKKLKLEYVDLFLIHAPFWAKTDEDLQQAWAAMEQVKASGKARSIGVSNFLQSHLEAVLATAKVIPSVNQIEFHPHLQHGGLVSFHEAKGIRTVGYGGLIPITRAVGGPLDSILANLAKKYGVGESEILLRWSLDSIGVAVTTSSKESRLASYLRVLGFNLTREEIEEIARVGQEKHYRAFWLNQFAPDDRS